MLPKLGSLWLERNRITDVGCAKLVTALESGALPALKELDLGPNDHASVAAIEAVYDARQDLFDSDTRPSGWVDIGAE